MHLKYFLRLLNGKDNEAYMKNIKKIIFFIIGLIIFGLMLAGTSCNPRPIVTTSKYSEGKFVFSIFC